MSAPVDATPDGDLPDGDLSDRDLPDGEPSSVPVRTRRRRRPWRIAVLTVMLLVLATTGWLAFRGWQAATALQRAEKVVQEVRTQLADADTTTLATRLAELEADAAMAHTATSDPVWRAVTYLPFVGASFAAVATGSAALVDVAQVAEPTLAAIDTAGSAQSLRGTDGRIDLAPLVDAAPALRRAAATVADADAAVAQIDAERLLGPLVGPVEQVQDGMTQMSGLLGSAARFSALLPPMLGQDGPRTYLLLSLNSAELRSAGGIVGAVAVLRTENGSLDLVAQRPTTDFPTRDEPVLPLTDAELRIHTDQLGRRLANTVMTPDFPRTAELVTQFWRNLTGEEVDGVIAPDAVAAADLLIATGPVVEPGGMRLSTDNFLDELLHLSYVRLTDPAQADEFYAGVATTIFRAVGDGQGEARRVVEEVGRASGEHRLRVWSAHPQEQAELVQTSAGGAFLSGGDEGAAGVFLNDGTAGKVDYFLTTTASVEDVRCDDDSTTATVRLDLSYDPPADIADYPRYVTGYSGTDLPAGWVATNLTAYAPVGGEIVSVRLDDSVIGGLTAAEAGRAVEVLTSTLAPGERASYRFELRSPRAVAELPVWLTPTVTSPGLLTVLCR
ncbi:MAG: DUF4012 domain-containing protein [Cellulomonas sp.]|nr:DUF4012 domain-containing protein [Cellulomonas sp.]